MQQKLINVNDYSIYNSQDYIVTASNFDAYSVISNLEDDWGFLPFSNILIISGKAGSGKTHLVKTLKNIIKSSVEFNGQEIKNIDDFSSGIIDNSVILLDDAHLCKEDLLFHLINHSKENKIKLLITITDEWLANLADLRSRINSIKKIEIFKPDDQMVEILILREFSKRSLKISKNVIKFLKNRLPRDYRRISNFIDKIDEYCLLNKKNISIFTLKKLINFL